MACSPVSGAIRYSAELAEVALVLMPTVADGAKIAGFYKGLFGRESGPAAESYQDWLLDGGQPWAGIVPAGAAPAGHWIPYVAVESLAATVSKAVDLGGSVIRDKLTGPAGNSVIVADPGGALIALFTPAAG